MDTQYCIYIGTQESTSMHGSLMRHLTALHQQCANASTLHHNTFVRYRVQSDGQRGGAYMMCYNYLGRKLWQLSEKKLYAAADWCT